MKTMVINKFGSADVFEEIELPIPATKPGHVLIKVKATSINPLDFKLRKGDFPDLVPSFPMVLHGDVAGTVVEIGPGVTEFEKGDDVYGCVGGLLHMHGALAEYVLADVNLIAHKPFKSTFEEAAALPLVALTAWEALITYANLQPGQHILIHGATGGVGHVTIQLAKWLNAKVYATSSSQDKMAIAESLGADHTINYSQTSPEEYIEKFTNNQGFDVVFDTVGNENLPKCFKAAKIGGKVISILAAGTFDLSPAFTKGLRIYTVMQPLPLITGINRRHYHQILTKVAALVDEGQIKPLIDESPFRITEVAKAHSYFESGQAIGKVVLSAVGH